MEPALQSLKNDIIIRNLIQHNHGIVRAEDLRKAGISHFSSTSQIAGTDVYREGDRIRRTPVDLRALANSAELVSEKLIP